MDLRHHHPCFHIHGLLPSVGNRAIDSNHKKLHDIVCRIQSLIEANDSAALAGEFRLLEEFAGACFSIEEEIARAVGFDFAQHDLAHQELLKNFRSLGGELETRQGGWSRDEAEAYKAALHDWLMAHLEQESRPLMYVLDTYLYDFRPTA